MSLLNGFASSPKADVTKSWVSSAIKKHVKADLKFNKDVCRGPQNNIKARPVRRQRYFVIQKKFG